MAEKKAGKLPRHLMDPNNPQRAVSTRDRSLGNMQKWMMSLLAVTTIVHMQGGLILGAMAIGEGHTDAQVGLMVIATIFGMLAVAAGMAIHQRHPLSPWLLLGLVPTLIGIPFVF